MTYQEQCSEIERIAKRIIKKAVNFAKEAKYTTYEDLLYVIQNLKNADEFLSDEYLNNETEVINDEYGVEPDAWAGGFADNN